MSKATARQVFESYLKLMKAREEVGEVSCQSFPDAFFPEQNEEISVTRWAKQACGRCPIQDLCLSYAVLANEEHGIWGGTSPRERQHLRSGRRVA
jgi:WhiB family redox-sensing transcriptional regulator